MNYRYTVTKEGIRQHLFDVSDSLSVLIYEGECGKVEHICLNSKEIEKIQELRLNGFSDVISNAEQKVVIAEGSKILSKLYHKLQLAEDVFKVDFQETFTEKVERNLIVSGHDVAYRLIR